MKSLWIKSIFLLTALFITSCSEINKNFLIGNLSLYINMCKYRYLCEKYKIEGVVLNGEGVKYG